MQWLFAFGFWIFLTGCSIADTFGEWEYVVENGEATITGYTGSGGAVIIPEELNGIPVGQIGRNWPSGTVYPWATVFGLYNTSLISLVLPNNVKKIGDGALSYCYELTSVTFGSGLKEISDYAFQFCSKLPAANFSYGLNTVGYGAFMACSSLVTISLPASITAIKPYAFNRNGIYTVTIPNGLTKVEKGSFSQCPNLTSVSIPSGITSIEDAAFAGCNSLTSITVPSSVTSLGLVSFGYCPALTRVEFLGNPPTYLSNLFEESPVVTIYFLSSVSGWGDTYAGRPTDILDGFRLSIENDTSKGELLQPVNYSSSNRSYLAGANLVISVAAKPGYLFAGWQGSLTSSSDTINIIMDSNKNVTASYAPDNQDNDSDGLTNFQESITYGTNPNQKDTNSDGIEDGQAVTLGYNPTFNFSALLGYLQSHPPTGLYTTLQYTGNYAAGQTAGRAEVTSFPATYNLYTTDQIQNMAIGDLVLTRDSDGKFTLEYNIEQSEDLQNWSVYSSNTQVVRLPPNKAFVRIKAKQ